MMARALRKPLFVVGALLAVLAISSCGGSDTSVSATSRAEFLAKANAVCDRGRQLALNDPASNRPDGVLESILPTLAQTIRRVEGLEMPDQGGGEIEAILGATLAAIEHAKAEQVTTIPELEGLLREPGGPARQAGLVSCAFG